VDDATQITVEMAKGFALNMVRAALNGRADELIELAPRNLRRWSKMTFTRNRHLTLNLCFVAVPTVGSTPLWRGGFSG
jgi:hypothetical protein